MPISISGDGPITGITSLNTTVDSTELGYLNGTTSAIQTQINAKVTTPSVWTTWTPTITGITVGNGTTVARYEQVGKTVRGIFQFTLGSTSAVTGSVNFTIPVPCNNGTMNYSAFFNDTGVAGYLGYLENDGTKIYMYAVSAAGSYAITAGVSATVPFTWASGDSIRCAFEYEAT